MRVNPNFTPDILTDLFQQQAQEQTYIEELSTGQSVNQPSDNPAAFAADMENQSLQSQTDQYLQNTSNLEGTLQTADSALSSVVTSLNQAISLGVQGGSSNLSSSDLQALAQQVQSIQGQVVQLANTSYEGSYLFGGTSTGSAPFALDSTQPSGVQYNGNTGVNNVEIAQGTSIQVNVPGSQIFQGTGGSVMGSLQQLVTALQSGNTTSIGTATTQVSNALNYLSQQRVFYGSAISQLDSNQSDLQQDQVNLQTQENTLVGANMATVATDLSQAQTAQSATLAALAQIIPQNLLSYLK
ncbi:MAG: flagellar hook-associated protein FlgL [Candidatus Sulfotelmatobacter sp.]|jgi:flagellar hook-associated protein 3 FlgL